MATLRIHLPDDLADELRGALGLTGNVQDIEVEVTDTTEVLIRRFVDELSAFVQQRAGPAYGTALPCAACNHPAEWHTTGTCDASFYNDEPCACLAYLAAG
jgi:hypothetical protein